MPTHETNVFFRCRSICVAITNVLALQTIVWNSLMSGNLNTVGGIMLTHELNNISTQEAIKWYLQLNVAFSVQ
ncbi:hypothetical protein EDB87DRAFT_1684550 [Lactarius vividus]|nr:hypothetical protein EDB87DRAFT_1684550 [Lactarius vividus]